MIWKSNVLCMKYDETILAYVVDRNTSLRIVKSEFQILNFKIRISRLD